MEHSDPAPPDATQLRERRERDREWVARLQTGDQRALADIFDAYYIPLSRYASTIVHSDIAFDIASDVFHALWMKREQIDPLDLGAYLLTAVRNRALQIVARQRLEAATASRFAALGHSPELGSTGSRTPEEEFVADEEARERAERVGRAFIALPPRTREVLRLWVNDRSYKDIGELLGISVTTVNDHIQRAKRLLRQLLGG